VELEPESREALLALFCAESLCGALEAAGATARKAIALPGAGGEEIQILLAQNLLRRQLHHEARDVLFQLLRLRPAPAIVAKANEMLDQWDALVGLYGAPEVVMSGRATVTDAAQAVLYAGACEAEQRHAAAATYYEAAVATGNPSPELYAAGARSAARAGMGLGKHSASLGKEARLRWRVLARLWLEEALEPLRLAARKRSGGGLTDEQVVAAESWLADPAIYRMFRPDGTMKFESYEPDDWLRLYSVVEEMQATAGH
jgi:hypothetical protein